MSKDVERQIADGTEAWVVRFNPCFNERQPVAAKIEQLINPIVISHLAQRLCSRSPHRDMRIRPWLSTPA